MKKASFTLETLITIIGVFIIFGITLSGKIDLVWILVILGGICLLHGLISLIKKTSRKTVTEESSFYVKHLLQIVLGGFILMLGLIELFDSTLPQTFWSGILVVICIIAVLWFFFSNKASFKK